MIEDKKRQAPIEPGDTEQPNKKYKSQKQWHPGRKGARFFGQGLAIEAGDSGIFATCDRGREAKCVGELRDLFQEYAEKLYGDKIKPAEDGADDESTDIAADINAEVAGLKKPDEEPLFTNVRMDVQCVIFFKTRAPIEPVAFVHAICNDAMSKGVRRTRLVKRLSPMTVMGTASEKGLKDAAAKALFPHFHEHDSTSKKFAIRPSIRNHGKILNRDIIIQSVAQQVGQGHKVDLKNYDLLILVEVYKNICGIGVVGADYEKLRRYNLAEIYDPGSGAAESKKAPEPKASTGGDEQ